MPFSSRNVRQQPSSGAEGVEVSAVNKWEGLAAEIDKNKFETAAIESNDPEKSYENMINNQKKFLASVQDMTDSFQPDLSVIDPQIRETLTHYNLQGDLTRVETIMDALSAPVPLYGQPANQRYIKSQEIVPKGDDDILAGPVTRYTINPAALKKDAEAVGAIAARVPENQRAPFLELQKMLHTYGTKNPDIMRDYLIMHQGPDYQTKAAGKMLRIAGLIVFASMTLITGLMAVSRMISHKKFELSALVAPALYAGITFLIASPSLRKTIANDKEEAFEEVHQTLNDKTFKQAGAKYAIGGKPWVSLYNNPELQTFDASTATDEEKREFAQRLLPKNAAPSQHEQFVALLDHPEEFASFQRLTRVRNADARKIILEYLDLGCSKYYRDMSKVKNALDETQVA